MLSATHDLNWNHFMGTVLSTVVSTDRLVQEGQPDLCPSLVCLPRRHVPQCRIEGLHKALCRTILGRASAEGQHKVCHNADDVFLELTALVRANSGEGSNAWLQFYQE